MSLFEKDLDNTNCTNNFIGLLVICLENTYKNYLAIELVYPRTGETICNLSELLDLNFRLIQSFNVKNPGYSKSHLLIYLNYDVEIDETKRENYVREANRWFKLIPYNEANNIISVLASFTSKDAYITYAPTISKCVL
jgi:hypothetical protein